MNKPIVYTLLLIVGMVWGACSALAGILSGSLLQIIPLAGLTVGLVGMFRFTKWLVKNHEYLGGFINMLANVSFLIERGAERNPEKMNEMISLLIMEPEEFQRHMP